MVSSHIMAVPKRPTVGQRSYITRELNLQVATKKDVLLLGKQIEALEKELTKVKKEILRAVKKAGRRRRGK